MVYDVSIILEELKGHEGAPDREIKIKLDDGTIREIEGFQFKNACIGGDDVIYITEISPLKKNGKNLLKVFLNLEIRLWMSVNWNITNMAKKKIMIQWTYFILKTK